MNSFRIIAGLLTAFSISAAAVAAEPAISQPHVIPASQYNFPLKDRYIATISSAIDGTKAPYKFVNILPKKERANVPLIGDRAQMPLVLFEHKNQKAPLAFVISGTGGTALAGSSLMIAGELYDMGYHVVTLPNPVSWTYMLSVSQTGLTGYLPRDSKEFYGFMQEVTVMLKKQGLSISSYSVVGYSYGGLLVAYLAQEDATQQAFNFKKVVAINPAVDVNYAIGVLDNYYDQGDRMTTDRKTYIYGAILDLGGNMLSSGFNPGEINDAVTSMHVQPLEERWLIGDSFRTDLTDMIFASQQIKDAGLIKTKADKDHWNAREDEIHKIGFVEYMNKLVLPSVMEELNAKPEDVNALVQSNSLYALTDTLKNNKNIYIMENADDFIIKPGDIEFMSNAVGSRMYIYPNGGHIGNLWHPRNVADLKAIMTSKSVPTPAQDDLN